MMGVVLILEAINCGGHIDTINNELAKKSCDVWHTQKIRLDGETKAAKPEAAHLSLFNCFLGALTKSLMVIKENYGKHFRAISSDEFIT